jgi:hypothetical protein
MSQLDSYEGWHFASCQPHPVVEAYKGQAVVSWYGNIERQLIALVDKYRNNRQPEDAAKVEQFLITWRRNEISGSINRSTIEKLEAAAAQLAVDGWKSQTYFSSLRDQLRKLIASEEELPRLPDNGRPPRREAPTGMLGAQEKQPAEPLPAEVNPPGGTPPAA